uniref:U-scoloptoxin(XY)-Er1b n=1 Tax=Ethmostigmus rubripes TaxID=62613 RepID=TXX1B_ETHRU|nr:RecName: Full=U-scoloptoxin(XY)-Er1b; Short=U-SLPTX(XY)-Er1b; AltName: Full=U-scoloptoxin-Er4.1a2b; Short=U-SLPTX-Er4.1a2b; Contains: RecName: Full=U-scoloptoxin-Er2.1a; Contains: RecName: Full=U-scoloptoxin-Er2.2b; Flags: Precursor [Ethmostigmus rubripes]AHY22595.1 U-SLPTX-Er4.1a2b precursor [Ethmostigmus rubripes]AHY22596.1 U-SLPTX-Er4.1a2b precursor [Ethmostigmus rubripes]AHY22601.1 U-SLPTX-Er4.1a2b precursor [Ethmostigmus rubripes]
MASQVVLSFALVVVLAVFVGQVDSCPSDCKCDYRSSQCRPANDDVHPNVCIDHYCVVMNLAKREQRPELSPGALDDSSEEKDNEASLA